MKLFKILSTIVVTVALCIPGGAANAATVTPPLPFKDVAQTNFIKEITWMKNAGITKGDADGSYRPYDPVTRSDMAAFMYRLAGSPSYAASEKSPFKDVHSSTPNYKEILWMRDARISTGWADWTFRPNESVNRETMAAFMHRLSAKQCGVSSSAKRSFKDTRSSDFVSDIAWMGGVGISTGWADGTYRPHLKTLRADMAAFLYRLNNHIVANGGCKTAPLVPLANTMPRAVYEAAYRERVYNYVKPWCPNARIILDHPSVTQGNVYGMMWWGSSYLAIRSNIPESITKSIALHECGHMLQARAYPNKWQAVSRMKAIYGGAGTFGLEENADCISAYLNPHSAPSYVAASMQASRWKVSCTGYKGEAAKKIVQGIKP